MNELDKLAKEKFNGDLRAAWSYVLYEVPKEERDRYVKYVSMEQLDVGMTAVKKGPRNEIDELADSKFGGDLKKTWNYIFSTCTPEEIDKYRSMADPHQAAMALLLLRGLRLPRKQARIYKNMEALHMSREEILHASKNPYAGKLRISLAKMALSMALITAAIVLGFNLGWDKDFSEGLVSILGIVNTLFAFDLADKLRYYFKFRSTKKALEQGLDRPVSKQKPIETQDAPGTDPQRVP